MWIAESDMMSIIGLIVGPQLLHNAGEVLRYWLSPSGAALVPGFGKAWQGILSLSLGIPWYTKAILKILQSWISEQKRKWTNT